MAVHQAALARAARYNDRDFLRPAAQHRRRPDGGRKPARYSPHAAGQASRIATARQPHLAAWPAIQAAFQALAHLCVGHSGLGDRLHHRFRRRGDGHRRRILAGADADLFPAHADRDRHWHLDGADARHHGVGDGDARRDQPLGRCGACLDPDGGWGHRRPIRGEGRTEDEWRVAPPPARPAGARGRHPLRAQPGAHAGGYLLDPIAGGRNVKQRIICPLALAAALAIFAVPAAAERLVASISTHRVMVTSNFTGDELVLFGGIERDAATLARRGGYDIVTTIMGPRQNLVTFRKDRVAGIWLNVDSRVFENAPSYL